ncbi:MAG: CotH kinase family protein [Flavobacteriales bacterium]
MKLSHFGVISTLLCMPLIVHAQILVNEIQHANLSSITDEDGDYRDWFELYNAGTQAVSLAGYGLSDRTDQPLKWIMPDYTLQPGEFLHIWASGKDRGSGPYYYTLVFPQDTWNYRVPTAEPDPTWRIPGGELSGWSTGPGGFGYGDGDDGTDLGGGIQSVYFRKSFTLDNPGEVETVVFHMDYDDSFVAYLNGVEIARANLGQPGTPPAFSDGAASDHEANGYQGGQIDGFVLDASIWSSALQPGENVLAVQVHNTNPGSSDMTGNAWLTFGYTAPQPGLNAPPAFMGLSSSSPMHTNFSLTSGEHLVLSHPSGTILNQIEIPLTASNMVYRRESDGGPLWCFSATPTPAATNIQGACAEGYEPQPVFSQGSGMYPGSITLSLSSPSPGAIIRYTVDGSIPDESSTIYEAPLTINATAVISARAFSTTGLLPSFTEKNTYLINESGLTVPVICLSTNPENLWDENIGIYVFGPPDYGGYPYFGANFWEDWERESYIEYYAPDGELEFEGPVGLKIHGGWSRGQAQKSFRVLTRDDYGMESIDYPLIADKPEITSYRSFNLRNGGNEYGGPRYHDALMQRAMKSTEADYMGYSPVVTFLNGEYWGMYELREHLNENYVEANHGVETNESTVISYNYMGFNVINGDPEPFYELYNWAISNDPLSDGFFEGLSARVDIGNYIDYVVAQTYYGNGDWSNGYLNNYKFWHDDRPGGKWRFMLMDLDFGLGAGVCDNFIVQAGNDWFEPDQIFNRSIQNPQFRDAFIRRYLDLVNTVFRTERLTEIRDQMREQLNDAMPRHCERWQTDYWWWYNGYDWRLDWNSQRQECIPSVLQDYFGLYNSIDITLDVQPAGAGRVHMSTVEPGEMEYPWTGAWFNGLPVTFTAIANPGYVFSHWGENELFEGNVINRQLTLNLEENTTFTAHFSGEPVDDYVEISEVMYNPGEPYPSQDWVELHNTLDIPLDLSSFVLRDGRFYNTVKLGTNALLPPGGRIVLAQDPEAFATVYPGLQSATPAWTFGLNNQGDEIRLLHRTGNPIIQFSYLDEAPWPAAADGEGPSMEYDASGGGPENPAAWFNGCPGGSPQSSYDPNCGSVSVSEEPVAPAISVYPNPANEFVWIRLPQETSGTMMITDIAGKRVAGQAFSGAQLLLADVRGLSSGMYIVQIRTAERTSDHQLLIQSR